MNDAATLVTLAGTGVASVGIITGAALHGWTRWLELKRAELGSPDRKVPASGAVAGRGELTELRERVRKLEAIASGVDY